MSKDRKLKLKDISLHQAATLHVKGDSNCGTEFPAPSAMRNGNQTFEEWRRQRQLKANKAIEPLIVPETEVLYSPALLFEHLCQSTVPYRCEGKYYSTLLTHLGFVADEDGNWYNEVLYRGENPTTAFMAHLDTASQEVQRIQLAITDGVIYTDGQSILGADDRAGIVILIQLYLNRIPGLYCLFIGEEAGCIGSQTAAKKQFDRFAWIQKAVSFDRRGYGSVITHQCYERTCSDEFALALCHELEKCGLDMYPDNGGLFTDSLQFSGFIPECTNISVGYENAHSSRETQDLHFLTELCEAVVKVNWEALETHRDPMSMGEDELDWPSGNWSMGIESSDVVHQAYYRKNTGTGGVNYDYPLSYSETGFREDKDDWDVDPASYYHPGKIIDRIVTSMQYNYAVDRTDLLCLVGDTPEQTVNLIEALLTRIQSEL